MEEEGTVNPEGLVATVAMVGFLIVGIFLMLGILFPKDEEEE